MRSNCRSFATPWYSSRRSRTPPKAGTNAGSLTRSGPPGKSPTGHGESPVAAAFCAGCAPRRMNDRTFPAGTQSRRRQRPLLSCSAQITQAKRRPAPPFSRPAGVQFARGFMFPRKRLKGWKADHLQGQSARFRLKSLPVVETSPGRRRRCGNCGPGSAILGAAGRTAPRAFPNAPETLRLPTRPPRPCRKPPCGGFAPAPFLDN